jgi:hypothetical protein
MKVSSELARSKREPRGDSNVSRLDPAVQWPVRADLPGHGSRSAVAVAPAALHPGGCGPHLCGCGPRNAPLSPAGQRPEREVNTKIFVRRIDNTRLTGIRLATDGGTSDS